MAPQHKGLRKSEKPEAPPSGRIVVAQDLVGEAVHALEARLVSEFPRIADAEIVLDLKSITLIDSRGIALCIGAFKECRARGKTFVIEASPVLYKQFVMLKLTKVIDIREGAYA